MESTSMSQLEAQKYEKVWELPNYGEHSPGVRWAELFGRMVEPEPGETVADFGCGDGSGGKRLEELYGLTPRYYDHVSLPDGPRPFSKVCLWGPTDMRLGSIIFEGPAHYGYCCDVMEHIPEQFTMLAAYFMLRECQHGVFFSISFQPDNFGNYIQEPLHLTVKPFTWWRDSLKEVGTVVDARDMLGEGVFYVRSR